MKPPLSLDVSYPTLIHVVSDPEGSCEAGCDVSCDLRVAQNATQKRRWRVELCVKFTAKGVKEPAYKGEVTYVGIFTVADDCPEQRMYRLIGVDAPSILYSSVRELAALLTGRSSAKTVLLPTVSFIENVVVPSSESEPQTQPPRVQESPESYAGEPRKIARRPRGKTKSHSG
jgi:preprotein translocase subunit SecB